MLALLLALSMTSAQASPAGIGPAELAKYDVTGFSRPCCNFGLDVIPQKMGLAGVIDPVNVTPHHFARENKQKDSVGIAYSCHGGFVDISHMRDNADWAAHIFWNLPQWLGSGRDVPARREGGFKSRSLFFPRLTPAELAELTEDDRAQIAVSAGYSMALLHEIATSFNIAVSAPASMVIYETSSAFSVEDAYSNLTGNILGVRAARHALPYNEAMTLLINERLSLLGAQPAARTREAYAMTRDVWWKKGMLAGFGSTLKRDFSHEGEVVPFLIPSFPGCEGAGPRPVSVPGTLSNGRSPMDYYEARGVMKKNLRNHLRSVGVDVGTTLSSRDYGRVIEGIKANFLGKLGSSMLAP